MNVIKTNHEDFKTHLLKIGKRGGFSDEKLWIAVKAIVGDVAAHGDTALFAYTEKFDGYRLSAADVKVSEEEIQAAAAQVATEDFAALKLAAERIERFHEKQLVESWSYSEEAGIELGQQIRPLDRVGIYAPGGLAFYPSTVLMAAIPAKVAGVRDIILVTPTKGGRIHPLIAAAVNLCGIKSVFKVGGAQAVAALAYGTESIPRVDKIVGPGNAYVTAAKQMVFGRTAIDMIAGPSEVIIICDGKTDPAFVAADMLAQAEHDALAAAILLTSDEAFARQVAAEIDRQLKDFPRSAIAGNALKDFGGIFVTADLAEAVAIANDMAPEHLELMVENPRQLLTGIRNAGAVMLGYNTPAAIGDYLAGPNHILPTDGTSRFSSPLGVYDFLKRTSILSFSREALEIYGPQTVRLAEIEGLTGHGKSITTRLQKKIS
jgi:histidinol dehydrogenase